MCLRCKTVYKGYSKECAFPSCAGDKTANVNHFLNKGSNCGLSVHCSFIIVVVL